MRSDSPSVDEKDEKHVNANAVSVTTKEVDTAAQLSLGVIGTVDPKEALRIRYVTNYEPLGAANG